MNTIHPPSDDVLVDLLDDALREARQGASFDSLAWRRAHPDVADDAATLLDTLLELSQAADVWRTSDTIVESLLSGDVTLVVRDLPAAVGRYQVRSHVGSGAMGNVYEAHDPQLDRRVAVKVPRCDRGSRHHKLFTERFIREARAAASVRHAHICPIYDAGEDEGRPYVVMAFVEGESLEKVLSRGRFDDVHRAVNVAIQVADALAAIHEHGIIHRDLKPGNILIDKTREALLTDFGLALSEMNSERLTSDGLIVGTPVYMSPEQAAGENSTLTPAADLYSLGAVLYEMLTGQAPFRAPLPQLLRKIMVEPPRPLSEARPDVDEQLSAIVMQALAKSPVDRHQSAEQFAGELREWLASDASPVSKTGARSSGATGRRSRRLVRMIGGAAVAAAVGVVSFLTWNGLGHRNQTATGESHPKDSNAWTSVAAMPLRNLDGSLTITIDSDPLKGPVIKSHLVANEQGALPLSTGELVRFEIQLNQPAYVYLLWVNPDGTVSPLYPWDAEHFATEGWDAPLVPGSDRPTEHVVTPVASSRGFETEPPVGLQTVVLLARRQPLDERIDLGQLLAGLPATPRLAMSTVRGPITRGVKTGQTKSTQDPQFDELEARLSPHFELMRVQSFPQSDPLPAGAGITPLTPLGEEDSLSASVAAQESK